AARSGHRRGNTGAHRAHAGAPRRLSADAHRSAGMSQSELDLEELAELVRAGDLGALMARAPELEPADLADVLGLLSDDERIAVVAALPPELSGQALIEMPYEAHAEET